MGSENRKKNYRRPVRLSPDELALLERKVSISSATSVPDFLRKAGLGYELHSRIDEAAFLELKRISGNLGRIGGLFKLYIDQHNHSDLNAADFSDEFSNLRAEIKQLIEFLRDR